MRDVPIAGNEPRAYAEGIAGFRFLELVVDRRVLIPRPETEGLVEWVLRLTGAGCRVSGVGATRVAGAPRRPAPDTRHPSVLDLGTGSGCIALSLATEGQFSRIVATDVSSDALEVARENALRVSPERPVEFRLGDLFEPVAGERFDVIVSNPPYIAEVEYPDLDPSVRDFEPGVALLAGPDGLAHTRRILAQAATYLRPSGLVALEVDSRRAEASRALARDAGLGDVRIERDVFDRPRFLLATNGEGGEGAEEPRTQPRVPPPRISRLLRPLRREDRG